MYRPSTFSGLVELGIRGGDDRIQSRNFNILGENPSMSAYGDCSGYARPIEWP